MADIRLLEDQVKKELDDKINQLGLTAGSDVKAAGSTKSTPY